MSWTKYLEDAVKQAEKIHKDFPRDQEHLKLFCEVSGLLGFLEGGLWVAQHEDKDEALKNETK